MVAEVIRRLPQIMRPVIVRLGKIRSGTQAQIRFVERKLVASREFEVESSVLNNCEIAHRSEMEDQTIKNETP